jgi:hypothetical protein
VSIRVGPFKRPDRKKRERPEGYRSENKKSGPQKSEAAPIWHFPRHNAPNLALSKTKRRRRRSFSVAHAEDQAITSATCFAHISKAAFFSAPKS